MILEKIHLAILRQDQDKEGQTKKCHSNHWLPPNNHTENKPRFINKDCAFVDLKYEHFLTVIQKEKDFI